MSLHVLDANVAVKWFLPSEREPHSKEALQLWNSFVMGTIRFIVPSLFWVEVANVFWKVVRQRRFTKLEAIVAFSSLEKQKLPTVSSLSLLHEAFEIANTFDRSVYDSIYVALAVQANARLITADERLANAVAAHLPVQWLGRLSE